MVFIALFCWELNVPLSLCRPPHSLTKKLWGKGKYVANPWPCESAIVFFFFYSFSDFAASVVVVFFFCFRQGGGRAGWDKRTLKEMKSKVRKPRHKTRTAYSHLYSLRSKRFRASSSRTLGWEQKKGEWRGRERGQWFFIGIWRTQFFLFSPPPSSSIFFFLLPLQLSR